MHSRFLKFFIAATAILIACAAFYWFLKPDSAPLSSNAPNSPAPLPESRPPKIESVESDPKLQTETDALLSLFDKMPRIRIFLKDEIINPKGSNTERGVAYTTCENKEPAIYVKNVFYEKANRKQLINILKHELTHAWQCRQGFMSGHDARFQKKFKSVGGFGN